MDPEVKKPRRLYKGDDTTAALLPPTETLVLQPLAPDSRLPPFLVVQAVSASWKVTDKTLTFVNPLKPAGRQFIDVPKDTALRRLTGRQGEKLLAQYNEWRDGNPASSAMRLDYQVGCDPEIFVVDGDGAVIPAWQFLPAKPTTPLVSEGEQYWDGFQAEFTVQSGNCLSYVIDRIQRGLKLIHAKAIAHDRRARLSLDSVLPVNHDTLASAEEKHVEFGCMPSLNIYGLEGNKRHGRDVPIRFAGGHLHFGCAHHVGEKRPAALANVIKALDSILAVSCVSLFANQDNPVRREYYGLPGEYRLPKHGIEYRTLSNAWLAHPVITNLVYDLARRCVDYGYAGLESWKATQEETVAIITNHDVVGARAVLARNESTWKKLLSGNAYYEGRYSYDRAYNAVMQGMESIVKDPGDLVGNWGLRDLWTAHCDGPGKNWHNAAVVLDAGGRL